MSKAEHSQGTWAVGKKVPTAVYAGNESPVCICDSMGETLSGTDAENARRIVACVNACANISTERLILVAKDPIEGMFGRMAAKAERELETVADQRDALLAALEYAMPYLQACVPSPRNGINADGSIDVNCVDRARAAIAAAKGGDV